MEHSTQHAPEPAGTRQQGMTTAMKEGEGWGGSSANMEQPELYTEREPALGPSSSATRGRRPARVSCRHAPRDKKGPARAVGIKDAQQCAGANKVVRPTRAGRRWPCARDGNARDRRFTVSDGPTPASSAIADVGAAMDVGGAVCGPMLTTE